MQARWPWNMLSNELRAEKVFNSNRVKRCRIICGNRDPSW